MRRASGLAGWRGVLLFVAGFLVTSPLRAQTVSGPLTVFNAGSLAAPFHEALNEFRRRNPGIDPRQESSGSLEAARKLTELGKIPDQIGRAHV